MARQTRSPPILPVFTPVPRKNTVTHGWTPVKQRDFIAALAQTGSVRLATEAVGMSHCGVYKLRTAPGGASFAAAWDAAVNQGADRIRDILIDQAINGSPEPIVYGGKIVGERRRFNHRTMMWVLQHHRPDIYAGGSTTHRRGWGERGGASDVPRDNRAELEELEAMLDKVRDRSLAREAGDAREAY